MFLHPRLIFSILFGILLFYLLPNSLHTTTTTLIAWNSGMWCYLILIFTLIAKADKDKILFIVNKENERGFLLLLMLSLAALSSLIAIVQELSTIKSADPYATLHYLLSFLTVFGSWCFVGIIFTLHYADMYYRLPSDKSPFRFPHDNEPNYWDFMYLSFTIAVAAQTSDVIIVDKRARQFVLFQSILSFIFNIAIIGLSINIAAGIIGQ